MTQKISINSQEFVLHPTGAIYWKENSMLLIADVHFGKVAHFRKHGAAIPPEITVENYKNLNRLLSEFTPRTICFLGDLFHSSLNNSWVAFKKWATSSQLEIILISGNHDIIPNYLFEEIGIKVYEKLLIESFIFTHHPTETKPVFNFCGHIHPGVKLAGIAKQALRLPCFFKTNFQLILPAFGNFTGKHILTPTKEDEIFVLVDNEVLRVSES